VAVLHILSAGAAQAVVEGIAPAYASESGNEIRAEFSAVGAMKARVLAGEPVDVVVLTRVLIGHRDSVQPRCNICRASAQGGI
jgi:molybdate transport system substrate-binding protein